jgi:DNA-directed RNA polymerase subunit RPC12/RpoP
MKYFKCTSLNPLCEYKWVDSNRLSICPACGKTNGHTKQCVVCDTDFNTPGIRCQECRDRAVPTSKQIAEKMIAKMQIKGEEQKP